MNNCLREVQEDNDKKWLSSKEPAIFAFTPRKLELECKTHCENYDTCIETKDRLARLLARNFSNINRGEKPRFNSERFLFADDR